MDVTRAEFNGLGDRLTRLKEDHIKCSVRTAGAIEELAKDTERQEVSIGQIYNRLGNVETDIAAIPGKIDSSVNAMSAKITKTLATVIGIIMVIVSALSTAATIVLSQGAK